MNIQQYTETSLNIDICKHSEYVAKKSTSVVYIADVDQWQLVLKISMKCKRCGQPFTFKAPVGFSTVAPTTNSERDELIIPLDYPQNDGDIQQIMTAMNPPRGKFN